MAGKNTTKAKAPLAKASLRRVSGGSGGIVQAPGIPPRSKGYGGTLPADDVSDKDLGGAVGSEVSPIGTSAIRPVV